MLKFKKEKSTEGHEQDSTDQQNSTVDVPDPGAKKKPRSEKQHAASRRNGARSHGPTNTRTTRYNAMRHGLRGQGLTPWDDPEEYRELLDALEGKYNPSDPFEAISISESALEIIRIRRINMLEVDNIIGMSSFSESSSQVTSERPPTIHFAAMKEYGVPVFDLLNRYKTAGINRLIRWRRELERVARDEPSDPTIDADPEDDGVVN